MSDRASGPPHWDLEVVGDPPLLRIHASGHVDLEHLLELAKRVPSTPGFRPGINSVVDLRTANIDFSKEDLRRLASVAGEHVERRGGGGFKHAYVVSSDLSYGLSRMLEAFANNEFFEFRAFRSMNEAMAWLSD